MLDLLKSEMFTDFSKKADELMSKPVPVDGHLFPAGISFFRVYKDMYDLALLLGRDSGLVSSLDGQVILNADQMKELLIKVGTQNYKITMHLYKLQILLDRLDNEDDVKRIKWSDADAVS